MRICQGYTHQQFALMLAHSQLEWNPRTTFIHEKNKNICVALLKSALLMHNVRVTEVIQRDSQTAAEIVEVSDVGWYPWLWGNWCETRDDQNYPLPEELSVYFRQRGHPPAAPAPTSVFVLGCSAGTTSVLGYNRTHSFFFLTSLLYGWPQTIAHREPIWLLPLSLKHDVLGS